MPVGWVAGAAVVGAALQADAAGNAADTQRQGARESSAVQQHMFDVSTANQRPFMESGYGSNAELSRLLGITPQTASGNAPGTSDTWNQTNGRLVGDQYLPPDVQTIDRGGGNYDVLAADGSPLGQLRRGGPNGRFFPSAPIPTPKDVAPKAPAGSGDGQLPQTGGTGLPTGYLSQTFGPEQFMAGMDPGYQWRQQQGAQNVMNTAAAGSGALSGPALRALQEAGQGLASQEYGSAFDRFQTQQGNIFQRLSTIAGLGQNAAAGVGNQAVATGGNIGANITGAANASAAGQIGAANAYSGGLSDLAGAAYLYGNRPVK